MTDHETDYKELRPLGEATQIPDRAGSGGSREQAALVGAEANRLGYPETVSEATDATCRACGAPIPAERTKCLFCLTNHIEVPAGEQDTPDSECNFLHVIHALVESRTFYGAVAKGSAACSLLAQGDADPAVDDSQLIYDVDEEPAEVLTRRWGELPAAVHVASDRGQRLLQTARERTRWTGGAAVPDDEHATFFYDESGTEIRDRDHLDTLLEEADRDLWLVPAIALQDVTESSQQAAAERPRRTPTRKNLHCWACERDTTHTFLNYERGPAEEWAGQPMWECRTCGTPRHGPRPGSES